MSDSLERVNSSDQVKIPAQAKLERGTLDIPFDPEYAPGAFNAVNVCLRVQAGEQVCVITDRKSVV